MPQFQTVTVMTANGTATPLTGWQYEYLPWPAYVEIGLNATTAGVVATVTSGSDTLMESSNLQTGATAGVIPSPLNVPYLTDQAAAGDRMKVLLRETLGGTPTVNGIYKLNPL
jgi:hypothetical protein